MTTGDWLQLLSRISPDEPVDLDGTVLPANPNAAGPCDFPEYAASVPPVSARLWERTAPAGSFLGVRVTETPPDCTSAALRVAMAAVERGVTPVILTTLAVSGFERFGFRVERLPEGPPEARRACEEELARFWSMAVIINAADIALFG